MRKNTSIELKLNNIKDILQKIFNQKNIKKDLLKDIDSVKFISVILSIEEKFKIKFDDIEITPENFKNISTIINLLKFKLNKN